jgi:hypothetical protein
MLCLIGCCMSWLWLCLFVVLTSRRFTKSTMNCGAELCYLCSAYCVVDEVSVRVCVRMLYAFCATTR